MYGLPGKHGVLTASIADGATVSDAIGVFGANRVLLEVPTFSCFVCAANSHVYAQVCSSSDGSFKRVVANCIGSAASGWIDWQVVSSTGNRTIDCPVVVGCNYVKVELSQTATVACSVPVHVIY